jgi:hypothetical protein
MATHVVALALSLLVTLPATDTVVSVGPGTRLDVDASRGRVAIQAWDRDAVRVVGTPAGVAAVTSVGNLVRVRPGGERGGNTELRISVPRWMAVRVQGNQVDVSVRGTEADVAVETVLGDVVVEGGSGRITVRAIQGRVSLRGPRGRVEVTTLGGIEVEDAVGELVLETTNGAIRMQRIRSSLARASTVNGSVSYDGTINDDGRYSFTTHNGSITVAVPAAANATVSASTFNGAFEAEFPVQLTGTTRDRQIHFNLGSGGGRIELESFNGEIRLRRPTSGR